jgi:hypothetical protein
MAVSEKMKKAIREMRGTPIDEVLKVAGYSESTHPRLNDDRRISVSELPPFLTLADLRGPRSQATTTDS